MTRTLEENQTDLENNEENPENSPDRFILTFGYGNRKNYQDLLGYLEKFHAVCLIDVRVSPKAWTRIWYKDQLEKACNSHQVKYISNPSLGNTSGNNNWIPPDAEAAKEALKEVAIIAQEGTILLLCAELDPARCHRSDVAVQLQEITNLPVKHLK